jgi:hypothetical protein
MNRALWRGGWLLLLAGCVLPAERVPLKPLGEESPPQPYTELLNRARVQATAATEAFYVNGWTDLEEFAKGLEQTARFLPKATEVPDRQKENLKTRAEGLEKDARLLRDAAHAQNVKQVNEIMQRINLMVRELRTEN